nr:GDP-mannose 4,6-dehydratase [Saccharofermentans sp.]
MIKEFYRNRKVLITGHTGFKGTWMCEVLVGLGADVYGYALNPPTDPSLFEISKMAERIHSYEGDVRDLEHLKQVFSEVQPEIVIH